MAVHFDLLIKGGICQLPWGAVETDIGVRDGHERLVEREPLDGIRTVGENRKYRVRCDAIAREVRRHDHQLRARFERAIERDRGAHTKRARFVRCGQYDRTSAPTGNRKRFAA